MRLIIAFVVGLILCFALLFERPQTYALLKKIGNYQTQNDLPALYEFPVKNENALEPPLISAKSAMIIDAKTGVTLFEKDPNIRHLPASTTKLMTALVALEKCLPKDIIRVSTVNGEGTQMGLAVNDTISVENLLYGLLISSGNDAAYALAHGCSGSFDDFIFSMNERARELNMQNTHFQNPAGFDNPLQYSTARDLALLAKVAVANPLIAKVVATKSIVLTDSTGNKTYYLENVNKLIGEVEGLEGVKTGQTEGSLEILITKTTRNGHTIIVSVLGSYDRFGETKRLIEWAFANHEWKNP